MSKFKITPLPDDPVRTPQKMDVVVAACVLRMHGLTQAEAADKVGMSERSLRKYESCSWWPQVQEYAYDEELDATRIAARAAFHRLLKADDGPTVRFALERLIAEFAPPATRANVMSDVTVHVSGGPLTADGY